MFIDLDQFKLINDSMGHAVGDQLLIHAAQRIQSSVRPEDSVGRISGDEFIVVAALDVTGASRMAERIRKMLGDGFTLEGPTCSSPARSGSRSPITSGTDAATLIQEADTAMYRSKDRGRNRVTTFDSSMRERVARRVELERISAMRSTSVSSRRTSNRSSRCRVVGCTGSRRSRGGTTADRWSRRLSSSRSRRSPA